ncbi:MAG: hypothetical protein JSV57_04340 [Candidatus Bathyarchaeota archaeon]|nr:MAG: hypothetical protein JSV57_04340 [Candidatus Bathyarchaeota archaeon]
MSLKEESKEKEEKKSSNKKMEEAGRKIRDGLADLKTKEGVIGYILRTSRSASIDLKDPAKIIDYAVLSSTALETAENLSETFGLGEFQNVLLEGKGAKILLLKVDDQRLSVFMEKRVDHEKIYKGLGV